MDIRDHRCCILVVEDEPGLRDVLVVALEADGYSVASAANGRAALRQLRSTPSTCVIVLDLTLPVMSGRHFRTLQLRDRSLAWIPIVVVSGALEAAREAQDLGACAFVRKPVDVDELRATIAHLDCAQRPGHLDQRHAHARH